jgi:hypothetical protein
MAISPNEGLTVPVGQDWHDELDAAAGLFKGLVEESTLLNGRIKLGRDGYIDNGFVDLTWRSHTPGNDLGSYMLLMHDRRVVQSLTPNGHEVSGRVVTKYAMNVVEVSSALKALWAAEQDYDLAEDLAVEKELYDLTDDETVAEFLKRFHDKQLGEQELQERLTQLSNKKTQLRVKRFEHVPDGHNVSAEKQLAAGRALTWLLEDAAMALPKQLAKVSVERELQTED